MLILVFPLYFSYVAPFIIAWLLASAMEPLVRWFQKCKMPRGLASILSIIIILVFIGTVVTGIVMRIIQEAQAFAQDFPAYYKGFMESLESLRGKTETFILALPDSLQDLIRNGFDAIMKSLTEAVGPGVKKGSIGFVVALPNAFLSVL